MSKNWIDNRIAEVQRWLADGEISDVARPEWVAYLEKLLHIRGSIHTCPSCNGKGWIQG